MKITYLVLLIVFSSLRSEAQEDAWVFFVDKENVASAIANPISILTQKAIDRKTKHGVAIDERDVPVSQNYLSQLKNATGISVLAKSKWFNAVHVRGNQLDIEALKNLSFVSEIDFANNSLNQTKILQQQQKLKLEGTLTTYNYGNAANQIEMINGNELHKLNYTGAGITIAVLDSGFPNVHTMSALQRTRDAGHILGAYNFVNNTGNVYTNTTSNHGTLVLSTIAGYVQDEYVGTAPDASFYLFITEDATSETPVEESYWVEAAERADSLGVDVINTSLGYSDFDGTKYDYTQSDMNGNTTFISRGANIAFEKGMLLVTSAGNSGSWGVTAPADATHVFTVGAVDASGNYMSFSSVGTSYQTTQKPDVVAQGGLSYVINENDVIARANGTSFSAPILAGGVACLWQALPNRTNAEIMQLVRESASQNNAPDNFLGYGIPDLQKALSTALSVASNTTDVDEIYLFPNPVRETLNFKLPSEEKMIEAHLYNTLGKKINSYSLTPSTKHIDVSLLAKGLYMLRVETNKTSKIFKIIKQ